MMNRRDGKLKTPIALAFRSDMRLFMVLCCVPSLLSAQTIDRPIWHSGDTWDYRITLLPAKNRPGSFFYDGRVSVIEPRPSSYRVTFGGYYGTQPDGTDRTVRFSLDLNRVSLAYTGGPENETKWYQWPLAPGNSWGFKYFQSDGVRVSDWAMEVKGWEKTSVPAGTFDTLHIVGLRKTLTASSATAREDIWYAPAVKRHVKYELWSTGSGETYDHTVEELTRYAVSTSSAYDGIRTVSNSCDARYKCRGQ